MEECITAEWARKTAQKKLIKKVQIQLDECSKEIKNSVNDNKMSATVFFYMEDLTKSELEKRGFKIKKESDQRDGGSVTISW